MKRNFILPCLMVACLDASASDDKCKPTAISLRDFKFQKYIFDSAYKYMLALSQESDSFVWEIESQPVHYRPTSYKPRGSLCTAQLAPNGSFLVLAGEDKHTVEIGYFEDSSTKSLCLKGQILRMAISPDSSKVAVCKRSELEILDSRALESLSKIPHDHIPHPYHIADSMHPLFFSSDGDTVIESFGLTSEKAAPYYLIKKTHLDATKQDSILTFAKPTKIILLHDKRIAFSDNCGKIETEIGNKSSATFDIKAKCEKLHKDLEYAQIRGFEISGTNSFIAIKNLLIFDTGASFATSKVLITESNIDKLSVSPDGNNIITLSEDDFVRLYDKNAILITAVKITTHYIDAQSIKVTNAGTVIIDAKMPELLKFLR